jgi:hypothetical protein
MKIYQTIFLATWLFGAAYIGSNRWLLRRLRQHSPAAYGEYQQLSPLARSSFIISLVTGENPAASGLPRAYLPLTLSRLFLGLSALGFIAFVASLVALNEAP